jgi:(1->4)-alpha-D-glucan 1-alpha-D-glucosylmutase
MNVCPPRATYRVQLHGGFRFTDAQALVPYLSALGIGPCTAALSCARAGS